MSTFPVKIVRELGVQVQIFSHMCSRTWVKTVGIKPYNKSHYSAFHKMETLPLGPYRPPILQRDWSNVRVMPLRLIIGSNLFKSVLL